ncbi:hypothetical protein V8C35DRAFT_213542 [Trichoderma chlorosporum]
MLQLPLLRCLLVGAAGAPIFPRLSVRNRPSQGLRFRKLRRLDGVGRLVETLSPHSWAMPDRPSLVTEEEANRLASSCSTQIVQGVARRRNAVALIVDLLVEGAPCIRELMRSKLVMWVGGLRVRGLTATFTAGALSPLGDG